MRFLATPFSTISVGLLILSTSAAGFCANSLKTKEISKEEKMTMTRNQIPVKDRWNVEALYANPEQWKKDFVTLGGVKGSRWPELGEFKGKLGNPEAVRGFFDVYLSLQRKLEKLHTYAHLRMDEDLGDDLSKSNFGLISTLIHEFSLETSWIEPELLSLKEEQFQQLLSHAELSPYHFYLEKVGRMRPHTLTPNEEELMALSGKALDASHRAFGALINADMTFPAVMDSKGKEHPLTNGSFLSHMRQSDRVLRKNAFETLHQGYEAHINTICELLQGEVEGHHFVARARKFPSCVESALFSKDIERSVYENLISVVREYLPFMHEYVAFRKKRLQVPDLHTYDLYVPLVEETNLNMNYEEARDAVIASVAPLGQKYQESLKQGLLKDRWVDVYENARKRSGAYSSGCYDSMPYILMNYHGTLNDVLTLAHEAGHSMHSLLSRTHQPYIYAQYPIFVAEVASTFNEQLLLKHLKDKAQSNRDKAFLINYQIEGIRQTIFRQTLFAEFELKIHEWAEEGTPITPDRLKALWADLNRTYYGPELVIDKALEVEWARIPHFYYNFYVYQYATGLSAALTLFEKAMKDPLAKERYLEFLSSGGSKYPLDLLEKAGADMRKPDVVKSALEQFRQLVEELKRYL